jgi:hypothetical protein
MVVMPEREQGVSNVEAACWRVGLINLLDCD